MFKSLNDWLYLANATTARCPAGRCARHDRHWVGDTGDGRADLFVYNHEDWGPEYLGVMRSTGVGITASWSEDWVGEWNLGSVDRVRGL